MISADELEQIKAHASATPEAVREREQVTDHDVAAFVDVVSAEAIGEAGRWVHYGLTSSDVLDTALGAAAARRPAAGTGVRRGRR